MRLTTSSCRLGGTILARMKQWQLSGSTAGCATGLPAFGDGPALCRKRSRWSTRPVCRLPRQSNSDKTHLATVFLIPSIQAARWMISRRKMLLEYKRAINAHPLEKVKRAVSAGGECGNVYFLHHCACLQRRLKQGLIPMHQVLQKSKRENTA